MATALKAGGLDFALAGSYAGWVRGAAESDHDVDFVVRPQDMSKALAVLGEAGLERVEAPEDWLAKVRSGDVVADVIHRLPMGDVDDAMLGRADLLAVESVKMPVLSADDLVVSKLLVLSEHNCDLAPLLSLARSLREQVDWTAAGRAASSNAFARAFLTLLADLGIVQPGRGARPCLEA